MGGNALIQIGQEGTLDQQFENLKNPVKQIAELSTKYKIVITHGNGPQVGALLLLYESASELTRMPLGVLVAETQGQIGFMIESSLDEALMQLGLDDDKLFVTILTYVQVDRKDPAFLKPTKPIGPAYPNHRPGYVKTTKGWRRVVPSPNPLKIFQYREVRKLIDEDFIVIACGGGGIPVQKEGKTLHGVEAVIDKDLASARLGAQIGADILLIATDVEKVALNYKTPNQMDLDTVTISEAKKYMELGYFPAGDMGPKVQAAINFLEGGGKRAIITSIDKIHEALEGTSGTQFILG